jgi:transposase, IS5 family
MVGQPGFFDLDDRLGVLSKTGDPLERLARVVDFEIFRPELDRALGRSERSKGGRPPSDAVLMFKILVLQALYGLSDEQAEYQIQDRLTFMRFLGLGLGDAVPDYSTIWRFREALVAAGAIEALFARFDAALKDRGYFALGGQVIDASIVEAPKQRLSDAEKARIKAGATAREIWPDRPAKAAHKDTTARWTVKRGRRKPKPGRDGPVATSERSAEALMIPMFGYKSHVNIDRRYRLIRRWTVSHAAAHDGARLPGLLEGQRGGDPLGRPPVDGALQEAQGAGDAGAPPPREPGAVEDPIGGRACVRRAEGPHGTVHTNRRDRPRNHQDRARQSGLQHAPADLVGDDITSDLTGSLGVVSTSDRWNPASELIHKHRSRASTAGSRPRSNQALTADR